MLKAEPIMRPLATSVAGKAAAGRTRNAGASEGMAPAGDVGKHQAATT